MSFKPHSLFAMLALIAGMHQAGAQLSDTGLFVNNGLLDIINAAGTLPPGFLNYCVPLDSSSAQVPQIAISSQDVQVQIQSAGDPTYRSQRADALTPASWLDIGEIPFGTRGVLTFTNSAALVPTQEFYRFRTNCT